MYVGVRCVEVGVHFGVILVMMSCFVQYTLCGLCGQKVLPYSNTRAYFETNSCTQMLVLVVTMSHTFTTCSFTTLFHYIYSSLLLL